MAADRLSAGGGQGELSPSGRVTRDLDAAVETPGKLVEVLLDRA